MLIALIRLCCNSAIIFAVEDENVLRQLSSEIVSGKLKLSQLQSLDLDARRL